MLDAPDRPVQNTPTGGVNPGGLLINYFRRTFSQNDGKSPPPNATKQHFFCLRRWWVNSPPNFAFCTVTDGTIHTSAGDQANDWRPPTLAERDRDGGWDVVPSGVPPSFGLRDDHSGFSSDGDSEASDAGDDKRIATANGTFSYTEDWNHIERSRRPVIAAASLLHLARQRTDTSRWWSMRWPSDAVSLVGRSLNLDTGKTCKLVRRLREHSITYLTKLWQLAVDRAGKRDNDEARRRLRVDWAETKRRLGNHGRNAKLWSRVGFRARWQQAGAICSTLLTFWKNSGEFRPGNHQSLELESQQIGREKGPHATVKCGYAHRFLPFLSLCC